MRHWKNLIVRTLLAAMLVAVSAGSSSAYKIFIDHSGSNLYDAGIPAWLTSWGNTVTVVNNYGGENLSGYDIVMDYDFDAWTLLTAQERTAYTSYLNRGGGLYLQGERPTDTYRARDESVLAFLSTLGAGDVTPNWIDSYANVYNNFQSSVPSPVTQNVTYQWAINRSLAITNPGNGFFVVTTNELTDPKTFPPVSYFGTFSNLIGFDQGQLLNTPNGRLIASFDISGMSDLNSAGWSTNQFLFREVIDYLGYRGEVEILDSVPEPSTLALLLTGSSLLVLHTWFRNFRKG